MISVMVKSTIILLAAACAARIFRGQSSAVRHRIWTAGLIGAMAVPLCSLLLPSWTLVSVPTPAVLLGGPSFSRIALIVWIAGAAVSMLVLLGGTARLGWVAIRADRMDDARWMKCASTIAQALRLRRRVRLLQNRMASFLGTWGVVSPRILLPSNAENWPDDRVRMVLAHELAHIKRHDWSLQVLAEAARAIYWFNPLFWIAHDRLRRESEHACDDVVLRLGSAGSQYAEELLGLARTLRRSGSPVLAMAQPSHLERRLVALLNPSLKRLAATPWATLVVAAIAIGVTLPIAAVRISPDAPATPPKPAMDVTPEPNPVITPEPPQPQRSERVQVKEAKKPASRPLQTASTEEVRPAAAPSSYACPVTTSVRETPLMLEKTAPLGPGPWHINENRTIWVWDQPYIAGRTMKTMWVRPGGLELKVTGRRLDGPAPPLETGVPCCYPTRYQAGSLLFPTPGCWEVTATAGDDTLVFVTRVSEDEQPVAPEGR
jgi:beta-lactamase regulating signal transducer with metallopeptidase domain